MATKDTSEQDDGSTAEAAATDAEATRANTTDEQNLREMNDPSF